MYGTMFLLFRWKYFKVTRVYTMEGGRLWFRPQLLINLIIEVGMFWWKVRSPSVWNSEFSNTPISKSTGCWSLPGHGTTNRSLGWKESKVMKNNVAFPRWIRLNWMGHFSLMCCLLPVKFCDGSNQWSPSRTELYAGRHFTESLFAGQLRKMKWTKRVKVGIGIGIMQWRWFCQ